MCCLKRQYRQFSVSRHNTKKNIAGAKINMLNVVFVILSWNVCKFVPNFIFSYFRFISIRMDYFKRNISVCKYLKYQMITRNKYFRTFDEVFNVWIGLNVQRKMATMPIILYRQTDRMFNEFILIPIVIIYIECLYAIK